MEKKELSICFLILLSFNVIKNLNRKMLENYVKTDRISFLIF